MTNIRGRYAASKGLLELELTRLLGSRDFAKNYGRSEWVADSELPYSVEVDEGDYKKLVICFEDGTHEDVSDRVSSSNLDVNCPKIKSLTITTSCGIISIQSEKRITAVRSVYKKTLAEQKAWVIEEHESLLVAYLRWQLLGDIDAKSANLAYLTYVNLLGNLQSLEVVS